MTFFTTMKQYHLCHKSRRPWLNFYLLGIHYLFYSNFIDARYITFTLTERKIWANMQTYTNQAKRMVIQYIQLFTLCKAIKVQFHDKDPTVIPRKCTRRKQVKSELILLKVSLWTMAADQRCKNRILLIVAVKMSLENILPHMIIITFSLWQTRS